jgi:biotin carboxyl carrier protein
MGMKYTVTVEGEVFKIEFGPGGRAWVNQEPYEVDLTDVGGQYSLLMNHRSYEVHVGESDDGACYVTVGGRPFRARLRRGYQANTTGTPSRGSKNSSRAPKRPSSDVEMRAPLPGLLVETQVSEGDRVEEQDVIAVLESMKMNLELRAPHSGVIRELYTAPGRQVAQDEVLAIISPNGASRRNGGD